MFYIKVLNTILKNDKNENIIFDNLQEKLSYFNIYTNEQDIISNYLPCNVDIKNGINITAIINGRQSKDNQSTLLNYNMYELLNCNYAFIYDSNGDKEFEKFRFYFVDKIYHDTMRNQFICTLSLDVIQTYYNYLVFEDCLIERCYYNRFYAHNNDYKINFKKNSFLLKSDTQYDSNIIEYKEKLYLRQVPVSIDIYDTNQYILDNVKYWSYYFIKKPSEDVSFLANVCFTTGMNSILFYKVISPMVFDNISSDIICLCAPSYRTENRLYIRCGSTSNEYLDIEWNEDSIKYFIDKQNLTPYILTVKISKLSPFYLQKNNPNNVSNIVFLSRSVIGCERSIGGTIEDNINASYFISLYDADIKPIMSIPYSEPQYDDLYLLNENYNANIGLLRLIFGKNNIKNDYVYAKEISECYKIELFSYLDNIELNPIIFNNEFIRLKYYETLLPNITSYIIDFETDETDSIAYENKKLYKYIQSSIDTYHIYNINKYEEFLTNNKNFYEINKLYRRKHFIDKISNEYGVDALRISDSFPYVMPQPKLLQGFVNYNIEKSIMEKTIDNYKYVPNDIENANANIYLNTLYNNLDFYIMHKITQANNIKKCHYFEKRYAYVYNIFDNINNVQNRKYYNYIKAQVDNVHIEYSNNRYYLANELIQELKNIFSNGISLFIHKDFENGNVQFDYTINNYEREFDI